MPKKKVTEDPVPAMAEGWGVAVNSAGVDDNLSPIGVDFAAEEPAAEPTADDWSTVPSAVHSQIFIRENAGGFDPELVKMMVYGESGTQKTRLGSTFPECLFLDIDKGMESVTEQVDAVDIDTFRQLEDAYAFLNAGGHDYTTVVIDTLNEMQRITMGATIEEFAQIKRSYGNLPSMSDYGKMLHDWIELTRSFIALPMRVVLLAQVNTRQFDTDILMPALIGKNSAREVARKMSVIGHIYKSSQEDDDGKKLSEICFDAEEYVTKDRSYKLPAVLVAPSYERISAFWK